MPIWIFYLPTIFPCIYSLFNFIYIIYSFFFPEILTCPEYYAILRNIKWEKKMVFHFYELYKEVEKFELY